MLPASSLARLVAWHQVAVTAAACWSALVGLVPLACLIIPVQQAQPETQALLLLPPVRYERAEPAAAAPAVFRPVTFAPAPEPQPVAAADPVPPQPDAAAAALAAPAADQCVACQPGAPAGQAAHATYGTAIRFNGNPLQAADEAARDKRLLFVLHISGNFEDDRFT